MEVTPQASTYRYTESPPRRSGGTIDIGLSPKVSGGMSPQQPPQSGGRNRKLARELSNASSTKWSEWSEYEVEVAGEVPVHVEGLVGNLEVKEEVPDGQPHRHDEGQESVFGDGTDPEQEANDDDSWEKDAGWSSQDWEQDGYHHEWNWTDSRKKDAAWSSHSSSWRDDLWTDDSTWAGNSSWKGSSVASSDDFVDTISLEDFEAALGEDEPAQSADAEPAPDVPELIKEFDWALENIKEIKGQHKFMQKIRRTCPEFKDKSKAEKKDFVIDWIKTEKKTR